MIHREDRWTPIDFPVFKRAEGFEQTELQNEQKKKKNQMY